MKRWKTGRSFRSLRPRRSALVLGAAVLVSAGLLQFTGVNPAASQTLSLTAYEAASDPGLDPGASAWKDAVPVQVPLTAQGGSYAAGGGSIPLVAAKALHYKGRILVRVEWDDTTKDESTIRVQDFSDAVAVEFPSKSAGAQAPALCMGQANAGVNIWQWRADSQAGLKDPTALYVGALTDRTPLKEKDVIFYTARDAGNPYANPDGGPTQTLVSQAFGTLSKAAVQDVQGNGAYANGKWAVVFARQLGGADLEQSSFATGQTTDMAIAVWNGSEGDRNGRKSVSQFVKLSIAGLRNPGTEESNLAGYLMAVGALVVFVGMGAGLGIIGYRQGRTK